MRNTVNIKTSTTECNCVNIRTRTTDGVRMLISKQEQMRV